MSDETNHRLEESEAWSSDRKTGQGVRELRAAQAWYRSLVEQMPAVAYIADAETVGRLVYISPQIEAMLGFTVSEFMADADLRIRRIHSEDRERVLAALRRLRVTGEPQSVEFRMLARDGRVVWVNLDSRLVRVSSDSPPFVQGFLFDISEHKRTEEALQRQRAFLRQVIDTSPDFIFAKDRQGRFTLVNQAVAEAYGTTVEDLLGKTDADFNANPEEVEAFRRADLEVIDLGRERLIPEELITDAAGKRRWLQTVKRPLVGPDGRPDQVLGVSVDITDRRRAEEQLRQSQKMEAVGQLAGGVAHDFNNLLGVITGFSELLARDIGVGHPGRRRLDEIRKAADRAAGLTRQLLTFSRKQVVEPKILNLNSVVAETEQMLRRLIGEDIELGMALEPKLGNVMCDRGQIEQVIVNLAINARDAMPRGGKLILETANVDLDEAYSRSRPTVRPGPHVMLAVSDTGHGMDQQTLARIFEPFFTTKEEGKGTGLGLSTVYGIVQQSGGNVQVYSEIGRGTSFKVYFPLADVAGAAVESAPLMESSPSGTETVLVAEDAESLRVMIHEILEEAGYKVLQASGPEQALSIAASHTGPIDLMLTDVVMPRISGREVAESLKKSHPGTRVLYMSGYTDEAISHHGRLDPGTHFIQKPFTADSLLRKVREVLDGQDAKWKGG